MALHFNDGALKERGFNLIAQYECFEKGMDCLNVKCYSTGRSYLVRDFKNHGKVWDEVFNDRDSANEYVRKLFAKRKYHKRVV